MDILFIRSNPVNPDSRVEKEVNSLLKAGHRVSILALDRQKDYKLTKFFLELENGIVDIYRVGYKSEYGAGIRNLSALLKFQISICKFVYDKRKQINVIHACDLDTAYTVSLLRKFFRFNIVYDIFDFYPDSHGLDGLPYKVLKHLEYSVIRKSDAVIICSEKRKEQIGGSKPKKLVVIHNSPPQIKMSFQPIVESPITKICYVGILSEGRMINELLTVVSENPNLYELHIGGFGNLDKLVESFSERFPNIIYYGKISYKDTIKLELQCDILTALYDPSIKNHRYAAPNKFYEGLMLGKPLIMIKNTGMDEIIEQNQIGTVIPTMSINDLENGLEEIVSQRKNWNQIKDKMNYLYNHNFSWNEMEKRLIKLYEVIK